MTKKGYKQSPDHIRKRIRTGASHHGWQGDSVSVKGGRHRTARLYKKIGPCQRCGNPKSERHHKDGNTANNHKLNIKFLCRRCHMIEDGRHQALITKKVRQVVGEECGTSVLSTLDVLQIRKLRARGFSPKRISSEVRNLRTTSLSDREPTNMEACMSVKDQIVTKSYVLYCGDACSVLPDLPSESIGFALFSPPFPELYVYSDSPADMANVKHYSEFWDHYKFLVDELYRLLLPGRIVAVHCMDLPMYKRNGDEIGLRDFPGDLIRCHEQAGFVFHARFAIWKNPLVAATRTKAIGLAHKQIVKDSALCRTGIPDYILAFRKPGENPKPIKHDKGLTTYYGSREVPRNLDRFADAEEQGKNKRSQWIWQQVASPIWMDIRQTRVLQFKDGREHEDEKHIAPLQLDVIERCMELWSTKGDVVLSPFMGIGSEVWVAVKNGRKGIGVELKPSYFKLAKRHLAALTRENRKALV